VDFGRSTVEDLVNMSMRFLRHNLLQLTSVEPIGYLTVTYGKFRVHNISK
jgi:hypothetical protein